MKEVRRRDSIETGRRIAGAVAQLAAGRPVADADGFTSANGRSLGHMDRSRPKAEGLPQFPPSGKVRK